MTPDEIRKFLVESHFPVLISTSKKSYTSKSRVKSSLDIKLLRKNK